MKKGLEAKLGMYFPVLPKKLVFFVQHLPSNYLFKDSCAKLDGDHDPLGETRTQNVPRHHFSPSHPPLDLSLLSRPSLKVCWLAFTGRGGCSVIERGD